MTRLAVLARQARMGSPVKECGSERLGVEEKKHDAPGCCTVLSVCGSLGRLTNQPAGAARQPAACCKLRCAVEGKRRSLAAQLQQLLHNARVSLHAQGQPWRGRGSQVREEVQRSRRTGGHAHALPLGNSQTALGEQPLHPLKLHSVRTPDPTRQSAFSFKQAEQSLPCRMWSRPPGQPRRGAGSRLWEPDLSGPTSVDVSPSWSSSKAAILRSTRRMILPDRVLGRPGAQWMTSGAANAPICSRTAMTSSFFSASVYSTPC